MCTCRSPRPEPCAVDARGNRNAWRTHTQSLPAAVITRCFAASCSQKSRLVSSITCPPGGVGGGGGGSGGGAQRVAGGGAPGVGCVCGGRGGSETWRVVLVGGAAEVARGLAGWFQFHSACHCDSHLQLNCCVASLQLNFGATTAMRVLPPMPTTAFGARPGRMGGWGGGVHVCVCVRACVLACVFWWRAGAGRQEGGGTGSRATSRARTLFL